MIIAWDAVPVYLEPGTGKIAVSVAQLVERNKREWRRRNPKEAYEGAHADFVREAMGASRDQKDRLTFVCRQALLNPFGKPSKAGKVEGKIMDSIFIVPCSTQCRLEDITDQGTWPRSHRIHEKGEDHREN